MYDRKKYHKAPQARNDTPRAIRYITTFRVCHYWGDQEECKFCDINNHVRELRALTGDHVSAYDTWVRRLVDAVDIMGEGNVTPNMVSGVEMAQPWGFDNVDDAVTSASEGFEYLMSHGVIPHLDTWCIEPGSPLEGHPPVPLDFLIRADIAWYQTWKKCSLPPFTGYGPMGGPGRAVYGNTASVDMEQ